MTINAATGAWLYTLDNDLAATQALNEGDTVTQTYNGDRDRRERRDRYADGHDHHHGTNDAPVISSRPGRGGDRSRACEDDATAVTGPATATGTLSASDVR